MKNIFYKIKLLLFTPTNLYIKTFVLLICILVGVFYFNYKSLKSEKLLILDKELFIIEKSVEDSLKIYKEVLTTISNKIVNESNQNTQKTELFLNQFYLVSDQDKVIPFDDIIWHDKINHHTISKYGKLVSSDIFSKKIENTIQNSANINILRSETKRSLSGHDKIYAVLRVQNHIKHYIGYLSIHIDLEKWLSSIQGRMHDKGLILNIQDKTNNKIEFSTDFQVKPISFTDTASKFPFSKNIILNSSNYNIIIGYKKQFFWHELFNKLCPQAFIVIISFAVFSLFIFLYKQLIHDHYNNTFKRKLEDLFNTCSKYKKDLEILNNNYQKSTKVFDLELSSKNKELECYKVSYNEKVKLLSLHHNKVISDLDNIGTLIAQLSEINSSSAVNLSVFEKNNIITELNSKLRFFPYLPTGDSETLDIEAAILIVRNIYCYDLLVKKIDFSYKIFPNTKTLKFDNLLLVQTLSNLLHLCIDAAKQKGFIKIEVSKIQEKKKEMILIKIQDNGFYLDKDVNAMFDIKKTNSFSYPFNLDLDELKIILKQKDCDYIVSFKENIKTQELCFYQGKEENNSNKSEINSSNVIKLRDSKK